PPPMTRHGGRVLADQLVAQGVDILFCVPGESYVALLDGLHDTPIRVITCRNEAGAANMAEAYGKLTGRPGVCVVTRGPGATHASVGVHTAFQDSTPLILLVGQVASDQVEREAFQEMDYRRMFGPMAKWVAQIDRTDRIPEYVARAFTTACAGRPGPVVLALPEDMLAAETDAPDAEPFHVVQPHPGPEQIESLRSLLGRADRPFVLLGGAGWRPRASEDMRTFLEANDLPAAAAFRRHAVPDNHPPRYLGDGGRAGPRQVHRAREQARARRDRAERRWPLPRLRAPFLALARLSDPARADERCDGLRRSRRGRRQRSEAGPDGDLLRRRRRLP